MSTDHIAIISHDTILEFRGRPGTGHVSALEDYSWIGQKDRLDFPFYIKEVKEHTSLVKSHSLWICPKTVNLPTYRAPSWFSFFSEFVFGWKFRNPENPEYVFLIRFSVLGETGPRAHDFEVDFLIRFELRCQNTPISFSPKTIKKTKFNWEHGIH